MAACSKYRHRPDQQKRVAEPERRFGRESSIADFLVLRKPITGWLGNKSAPAALKSAPQLPIGGDVLALLQHKQMACALGPSSSV